MNYTLPEPLTRRGFLQWLPGGSELFCKIQTGLPDGFSKTQTGISASKTVCGLGKNTEFTQALIAAISSGSPPDISMLWDSLVSLGAQRAFMPLDDMMAKSRISLDT